MVSNLFKNDVHFRRLIDALPMIVIFTDSNMVIQDMNQEARDFFCIYGNSESQQLCGDAIHCMNQDGDGKKCGQTPYCSQCIIRKTVGECEKGNYSYRKRYDMNLNLNGSVQGLSFLVTTKTYTYDSSDYFMIAMEDISELTELRNLIPICASCKKIRDDKGLWNSVEAYFHKYSQARFTHGICPDCAKKLYPELEPKKGS